MPQPGGRTARFATRAHPAQVCLPALQFRRGEAQAWQAAAWPEQAAAWPEQAAHTAPQILGLWAALYMWAAMYMQAPRYPAEWPACRPVHLLRVLRKPSDDFREDWRTAWLSVAGEMCRYVPRRQQYRCDVPPCRRGAQHPHQDERALPAIPGCRHSPQGVAQERLSLARCPRST